MNEWLKAVESSSSECALSSGQGALATGKFIGWILSLPLETKGSKGAMTQLTPSCWAAGVGKASSPLPSPQQQGDYTDNRGSPKPPSRISFWNELYAFFFLLLQQQQQ